MKKICDKAQCQTIHETLGERTLLLPFCKLDISNHCNFANFLEIVIGIELGMFDFRDLRIGRINLRNNAISMNKALRTSLGVTIERQE